MNEEKNIIKVIGQFKKFKGTHEILVGDGGSKDKTRENAKKMGAKVYVKEGTIGEGRNVAAEHAKGKIFVFCDADTLLENVNEFMKKVENIFEDKKVVAASPKLEVFPKERKTSDLIVEYFFNKFVKMSFSFDSPFSFGQCQIVRASVFRKVGGYDGWRVHAEDTYLYRKLKKFGKIVFINEFRVFESPRRYRKWGYFKLICISFYSILGQKLLNRNMLNKWERIN
jgi:glycosyltransferase involved in cell wall biosynthesis